MTTWMPVIIASPALVYSQGLSISNATKRSRLRRLLPLRPLSRSLWSLICGGAGSARAARRTGAHASLPGSHLAWRATRGHALGHASRVIRLSFALHDPLPPHDPRRAAG